MAVLVEWVLHGETHRSEFMFPIHAEGFVLLLAFIRGTRLVSVVPCI